MAMNLEELLDEERRPYAAAANLASVLERVRRINLPATLDNDLLRVIGIPEASLARVIFALRFLRLIDATGRPTDVLRAIARASDDEYRELLAGVVREAYAADFARVDPAHDTQTQIESVFRRYEPRSQTMRMVMLFLGLCRMAGMPVVDAPRRRGMQTRATGMRPARTSPIPAPANPARRSSTTQPPLPATVGQTVSISVDDLALIDDQDAFDKAWAALGVVTRLTARARQSKAQEAQSKAEEEPPAEGGD